MYRVNMYSRRTTIKMTSRLSYCMWFTTLITLDFVLSATIPIFTGLTDSEQTRRCEEKTVNSELKDEFKWIKNSSELLDEKNNSSIASLLSWEEDEILEANTKEEKEFKEWDAKMQEVTRKQLEKWKRFPQRNQENEKIKSHTDYEAIHEKDQREQDEEELNSKSKNQSNIDWSLGDLGEENALSKKEEDVKDSENKNSNEKKLYDEKHFIKQKKRKEEKKEEFSHTSSTHRSEYQIGRRTMNQKILPKKFQKEISTGRREEYEKNIRMNGKSKTKPNKFHNRNHKMEEKVSELLNNSADSQWSMSAISPPDKLSAKIRTESQNMFQFFNTSPSPSSLSSQKCKNNPVLLLISEDTFKAAATTDDNSLLYENTNINKDKQPINSMNRKIGILFSQILHLNPIVWMFELPVYIKQKLEILPGELTNPWRDVHFINSSIIFGQMHPAATRVETGK